MTAASDYHAARPAFQSMNEPSAGSAFAPVRSSGR
jgi:hypothetical protein